MDHKSPRPTPLVSIICITYNHERYIRQALESFLMQRCNFVFEIVIHDDASTDNTAGIIREYAERYPGLFNAILRTENQYSKGVDILASLYDISQGKYVAVCEGDDYWIDPTKLQRQVDFLESSPAYSMCFHNAVKYYDRQHPAVEIFNNYDTDRDLSLHDAIHGWVVPTASIVGRKELMAPSPQWLCRIYSGDYSLILIMFNAGKVRYINRLMSVYRINLTGSSMSGQMLKRNIFMLEQKIMLLESYDKGTAGKYSGEVVPRIQYLKKELKFQKAKERKNILALLCIPGFVISKLIKKARI